MELRFALVWEKRMRAQFALWDQDANRFFGVQRVARRHTLCFVYFEIDTYKKCIFLKPLPIDFITGSARELWKLNWNICELNEKCKSLAMRNA